jgi:hypothetical protein
MTCEHKLPRAFRIAAALSIVVAIKYVFVTEGERAAVQ